MSETLGSNGSESLSDDEKAALEAYLGSVEEVKITPEKKKEIWERIIAQIESEKG